MPIVSSHILIAKIGIQLACPKFGKAKIGSKPSIPLVIITPKQYSDEKFVDETYFAVKRRS
jgi:hypothetical protein